MYQPIEFHEIILYSLKETLENMWDTCFHFLFAVQKLAVDDTCRQRVGVNFATVSNAKLALRTGALCLVRMNKLSP